MTPQSHVRPFPPEVDEGDLHNMAQGLRNELRPIPGRLADSMRILVVVLAVVAVGETLRVPDVGTSAIVVLFLSKSETVSTVQSALIAGTVALLAIFVMIVCFMLSLSEPALRVLLMAVGAIVCAWLSRVTMAGPLFMIAGYSLVYGLTLGDLLHGLALQPARGGNAPQLQLPNLASISSEEALLQTLLWLAVTITMPVALLIAGNLLMGRNPELLLRAKLADRLAAAAAFCAGEERAEQRLETYALEGTAELRMLHQHAGILRRPRQSSMVSASLIDAISRLGVLLLGWSRVAGQARGPLLPAVASCQAAQQVLRGKRAAGDKPGEILATGAARPLADWIARTLRTIGDALAVPPTPAPKASGAARAARGLLAADAWSNPEYLRFALKVALAVMLCYLVMVLAAWPGISTCIITCFLIALGSVGEMRQKAMLRIVGCLLGAALGLAAIVFAMPRATQLGGLLLLIAPATLLAAWVSRGTFRTSYAGMQIGVAFYLIVLHGFGPTTDLSVAKDRIVGILLGNIVMFAVFTTVWPVKIADVVRRHVSAALSDLGALLGLGARADGEILQATRSTAASGFGRAIAGARALLAYEPFEAWAKTGAEAPRRIDVRVVERIAREFVPVAVILDLRSEPAEVQLPPAARAALRAHHQGLAGWYERAASWVRSGEGAEEVSRGPAQPPAFPGDDEHLETLATWYRILHEDIGQLLAEAGPQPRSTLAPPIEDAFHAAR